MNSSIISKAIRVCALAIFMATAARMLPAGANVMGPADHGTRSAALMTHRTEARHSSNGSLGVMWRDQLRAGPRGSQLVRSWGYDHPSPVVIQRGM